MTNPYRKQEEYAPDATPATTDAIGHGVLRIPAFQRPGVTTMPLAGNPPGTQTASPWLLCKNLSMPHAVSLTSTMYLPGTDMTSHE